MARAKFLLSILLICAWPAFAQLDGGTNEKFDPQVEQLDDDTSIEQELKQEPAVEPSAPAPGTLDKPKEAARPKYQSNDKVIFDWSKYQNATEVPHPFVEKGLLRITRDKTYIYRVGETEQKTAAQFRVGTYNPDNLKAPPNSNGDVSTFEDNYNQTDNPSVLMDWEWQLWKSPIGKWGATLGAGAYVAQGNGHFAGSKNAQAGLTPREIFTLAVIPINVGAVYRLQIWDKQLFVPYAAGGGVLFAFGEFRDDNKAPKFGGSYGAYWAAGMAMSLTYFDALSKIQLDREYGINAVYLTGEYRSIVGLSPNFDFSSDMANAGFLMEY